MGSAFEVDGFHVHTWGASDGRSLVFLHALLPTASGAYPEEMAGELCDGAGYRLIAPDMPGFGSSPALPQGEYLMESLARRCLGAFSRMGLERVVLIGHSWGAALACHITAMEPERVDALVLLDGGHFDHADLPEMDPDQTVDEIAAEARDEGWRVDAGSVEEFLAVQKQQRVRWNQTIERILLAAVITEGGHVTSVCTDDVVAKVMKAMLSKRSSDAYTAIHAAGIPLLLLTATVPEQRAKDNRLRSARFQEAIPHAEVRRIEGAGHDLVIDAGPTVAREIGNWLGGIG